MGFKLYAKALIGTGITLAVFVMLLHADAPKGPLVALTAGFALISHAPFLSVEARLGDADD